MCSIGFRKSQFWQRNSILLHAVPVSYHPHKTALYFARLILVSAGVAILFGIVFACSFVFGAVLIAVSAAILCISGIHLVFVGCFAGRIACLVLVFIILCHFKIPPSAINFAAFLVKNAAFFHYIIYYPKNLTDYSRNDIAFFSNLYYNRNVKRIYPSKILFT